jgi:hypothetical protein
VAVVATKVVIVKCDIFEIGGLLDLQWCVDMYACLLSFPLRENVLHARMCCVVLWCGVVVLWCCGVVVLLCCGVVVLCMA